jgi:hypothetical protein
LRTAHLFPSIAANNLAVFVDEVVACLSVASSTTPQKQLNYWMKAMRAAFFGSIFGRAKNERPSGERRRKS